MKTILSIALVLAASLAARADESSDHKPQDDQKALQGDWVPAKAELGGKPMSDDVLKTISLKLIKNDYEVLVAGKPDKGTWSIDPDAKPKAMTVKGVKGPNAGKTFPAIYELDGDTLRICYDLSGKARPKEFKTTEGTKLYLVTYKRKKQ
ncbi:MAG TPA: TIGR03067 domain-containing protein [Lacipirellulaceae bacterium]|nr:TIGR03067 domain-containing protein [Lacipirellulaceae bacterium]